METEKILIGLGCIAIFAGVLIHFGVPIGKLPGDILIKKENFTLYIPITTMIIASIIFAILFRIWRMLS